MIKKQLPACLFFLISIWFSAQNANAQIVVLKCEQKELNEIFLELRDKYKVEFVFNNQLIKGCFVSKNNRYSSPELAIEDLVKECNLSYKKNGNVFIILPKKGEDNKSEQAKKYYNFSGKIIDSLCNETLPSAVIKYKNKYCFSNANGNFSFKSTDSRMKVKVLYLGYYEQDTLLFANRSYTISIVPSVVDLKEVLIQTAVPVFDMHLGESSGQVKLNHRIASFLPGNRTNSIYNMLRLQTGIMAAGEQTSDYTIWGSYQGQNMVLFDNITLFNISSFDDNISVVNPLIINDIEVKRGGYNVDFSNRVGGVVNISGNNGNHDKFSGKFNINNQALSSYLNIPIAKGFAFQAAYRKSFYDLLDWRQEFNKTEDNNAFFLPDYDFEDVNLKLSGRINETDNFYINYLSSSDNSKYETPRKDELGFFQNVDQTKKQNGASFLYNKYLRSNAYFNVIVSYSDLSTSISNDSYYFNNNQPENKIDEHSITKIGINEFAVKTNYYFPLKGKNQFTIGIEYANNTSTYSLDTSNVNMKSDEAYAERWGAFVKDNISISDKIRIQPGIRIDYPVGKKNQFYFQPRINATVQPFKKWKINLAYGIYNQFISKSTMVDEFDNHLYLWDVFDENRSHVIVSQHYVAGFSFNNLNLKFSLEGFYKETDNIGMHLIDIKKRQITYSIGESNSIGLDFYVKTKIRKHEFWAAYTLGKTMERFEHFFDDGFRNSLYDQTHELKGAAVFNFYPFYVSANYVYGSGLEFTRRNSSTGLPVPYSRLDLAVLFKFNFKKVNIELGASVLNILNTQNVKYNDFISFPNGQVFYSKSTPFTPLLNLHIGF